MTFASFLSHNAAKPDINRTNGLTIAKENGPVMPPERSDYPDADGESCCHNYSIKANHYTRIDNEANALIDVTFWRGASRCHSDESLLSG